MSDPAIDPALLGWIKAAAGWVWALVLGLFGWLGQRQITRLDAIESSYVRRDEFDRTVAALRNEIATGNRETHQRLDKMLLLLAQQGQRTD